ncbi:hypothetical protein FA13DRAFT_1733955 [Coprinellus micaceus]|uniref:Zn(2)-C6 fungal-type domain-containing protein n=1 Tax=Coprinellus micaceus TaxID=71717 RepID=A0A4Y7T7Q6_COPMI|nr:hypothetical protein FA13DRAFT_1733955 [Coprinellus micaceus]
MSVASASSLACRPCRHRKIKCQNSLPTQTICDNCRSKGKDPNDCKYIPVAEDFPARPRQSPPAALQPSYGYGQIIPASPVRERHAPIPHPHSPPPQPTGYYPNAYVHYTAPHASTSYPSPPPVQLQHVQSYGTYSQPGSPDQSYSEGASGMVAPEVEYNTWAPQVQLQPSYSSPGHVNTSVPVAQDTWPANVPDQMVDQSATYYDQVPASPTATYTPAQYQQPSHQYQYTSYSNMGNGSYYAASP